MIPAMDLKCAEVMLSGVTANTAHHQFLAFLFAASRAGHLSVKVDKDALTPCPKEVWEEIEFDMQQLLEGAHTLPTLPSVVYSEGRFYLERLFVAKERCEQEWSRLQQASPQHPVDSTLLALGMDRLRSEMTEEQLQAINLAASSSLVILTGGPGTGKTFTAGRLLNTLWRCLPSTLTLDQIAIAAPTGKAALNLQTSLRKALSEIPESAQLKAKTIHSLLGIKGERLPGDDLPTLPYSWILIDEASMIDVELMAQLLRSIKSGARLLLIGDPHQLPPVEGPAIFPSLTEKHPAKIALTRCLRTDMLELVQLAEQIKLTGKLPDNLSFGFSSIEVKRGSGADKTQGNNVKRLDNHSLDELIEQHLYLFPRHFPAGTPPEAMLAAFQAFCILTPLRKGALGSEAINRAILQRLHNPQAIPIMIAANDYRFQLFNGEIGILQAKNFQGTFCKEDLVYFPGGRTLPALLLPRYELAYAMTVHKSQGSEFNQLLLLLPHEEISPALLYTAVTRARKQLSIWVQR